MLEIRELKLVGFQLKTGINSSKINRALDFIVNQLSGSEDPNAWDSISPEQLTQEEAQMVTTRLGQMTSSASPEQRIHFSDFMLKFDRDSAIPYLHQMLRSDPSPLVRQHLVWILGDYGDATSTELLLDVYLNDFDEDVRMQALNTLNFQDSIIISIVRYVATHDLINSIRQRSQGILDLEVDKKYIE